MICCISDLKTEVNRLLQVRQTMINKLSRVFSQKAQISIGAKHEFLQ